MSDIVERLRAYGRPWQDEAAALCDEAADEIERLRACLFQMQEAAKNLNAALTQQSAPTIELQRVNNQDGAGGSVMKVVDHRPRCVHGVVFPMENCTTCLRAALEAAREDAASWEQQTVEREKDCIQFAAERDALMADAQRYRWLASRRGLVLRAGTVLPLSHSLVANGRQYQPADTLDEMIDKAMSLC